MKKIRAYLAWACRQFSDAGQKTSTKNITHTTQPVRHPRFTPHLIIGCILFGTAAPAQANFFVSDKTANCTPCKTKPASSNTPEAWKTPTLTKTQCDSTNGQCGKTQPCPASFEPACKPEPHACITTACKTPTFCPPREARKVVAIVYEGSLKNNIDRIAREHGWCHVVWDVPVDYRWIGTAKVTGTCLNDVMDVILQQFPLEITFYEANHVVAITPRKYHS